MNERTAEFLAAERERYEYLLLCAKDADHEELAWGTIVAKMTVEDFVTAAKEVLAAREVVRSSVVAGVAFERLVNYLSRQSATWTADAIAAWDAIQVVQQDISRYRKATGRPAAADQPPGEAT